VGATDSAVEWQTIPARTQQGMRCCLPLHELYAAGLTHGQGQAATDAEFVDFLRDFRAVFLPRLVNAPGKGRRRRMVYSVLLPAPEKAPGADVPAADAMSRSRSGRSP
jgi:hypothetical protein